MNPFRRSARQRVFDALTMFEKVRNTITAAVEECGLRVQELDEELTVLRTERAETLLAAERGRAALRGITALLEGRG